MNKSRFQAHRGGRTARASIGLLTVCCLLFGCGESRLVKSSRSAKTESGAKGKSAADAAADRCQTLFSGALAMMKPENLGVSSESTGVVSVLNNWAATCGAAHGAPPDPELTRLLSESEQKIAAAAMFDVNDVEHIRDCWLFQRAGRAAAESTKDDADRATKLFELACRTVGLAAPEQLLPQMP